jgi:hypothetical protein
MPVTDLFLFSTMEPLHVILSNLISFYLNPAGVSNFLLTTSVVADLTYLMPKLISYYLL